MDRKVDITKVDNELKVQFSYSVEFKASDLNLRERMSRYAESRFLPTSFEIHWLSIVNSFVLVLLLTAFLTILLRSILKNHDAMDKEEVGWSVTVPTWSVSLLFTSIPSCCYCFRPMPLLMRTVSLEINRCWCVFPLETNWWWCFPLSRAFRCVLRCRWHWQPAHCSGTCATGLGSDWYHLDNKTRIDRGWSSCSLLSDFDRRRIYLNQALSTNDWKELGAMRSYHRPFVPGSCRRCLRVGQYRGDQPWFYQCFTLRSHLDHNRALHVHFVSFDRCRWNSCQELCKCRIQCSHPHYECCPWDPKGNSMVPRPCAPGSNCWVPSLLSNLCWTPLCLSFHVGPQDQPFFWNSLARLYPSFDCDIVQHCGSPLLPVGTRRPPLVVGNLHQWRNDRGVYLLLLISLFLSSQSNGWNVAGIVLLWVHGSHLVCIFPDVGQRWIPVQLGLRKIHLLPSEVWIKHERRGCGSSELIPYYGI